MTAPVVGVNSPEQLNELLPAAKLQLTHEEVSMLEEVSGWERSRTEGEGGV